MWPFPSARLARDTEIIDLVFKLRARITALEERADASEAAAERLRGRLYATGAHKPPQEPQSPTKADVLREAGFVPGRPMRHT